MFYKRCFLIFLMELVVAVYLGSLNRFVSSASRVFSHTHHPNENPQNPISTLQENLLVTMNGSRFHCAIHSLIRSDRVRKGFSKSCCEEMRPSNEVCMGLLLDADLVIGLI